MVFDCEGKSAVNLSIVKAIHQCPDLCFLHYFQYFPSLVVRLVPCRIVNDDSGSVEAGTAYKQKGALKVLFKYKSTTWSSQSRSWIVPRLRGRDRTKSDTNKNVWVIYDCTRDIEMRKVGSDSAYKVDFLDFATHQ